MAKSLSVHNICWCVFLSASTSTISMQQLRPITWCPKGISPTPHQPFSTQEHLSLKCHLAFCLPWKTTASTEFMILLNKQQKYLNRLEELVYQFTTSALQDPTSQEPMGPPMELFPCFVYSMTQLAMSTKGAVNEKDHLQSMSNHGMLIFLISSTWRKTMERKKCVPGICSTPCGSLTCLCVVLRKTLHGLWCVPMSALDCMILMAMSLRKNTSTTKKTTKVEKPYRLVSCGKKSSNRKSKQEHLICCIKMRQIESRISKILEPFALQTCALRFWNTPLQTKWRFVTSLPSPYQCLSKMAPLTIKDCMT